MLKIIVKLTIEGIHRWQGCNIEEVSFLKDFHRHIFYITCKKEVVHDDREIEIIAFKRRIQNYLIEKYAVGGVCCFGNMSCEMLAAKLLLQFNLLSCEVLEDNENGAEVTL